MVVRLAGGRDDSLQVTLITNSKWTAAFPKPNFS